MNQLSIRSGLPRKPIVSTCDESALFTIIQSVQQEHLMKYNQWCDRLLELYPPKRNEFKFIYGGISGYLFKYLLEMGGNQCEMLSDDQFFDDIVINGCPYSIKTTKSDSDIIITNYRKNVYTCEKILEVLKNRVIIVINFHKNKIYFIPTDRLIKSPAEFTKYFKCNGANLSMKKQVYEIIPKTLTLNINVNSKIPQKYTQNIYEKLAIDIIGQ